MKYKKKPVEVDAFPLTVDGDAIYPEWFLAAQKKGDIYVKRRIRDGTMVVQGCTIKVCGVPRQVSIGDFIVQLANGEIYSHSPDIFHSLYTKCEK